MIQFIDARHDVQKNDLQMREWADAYELPIFTVVTKIDYIPRGKQLQVINKIKKDLSGETLIFSALDRQYCEKILEYLLSLCV